MIKSPEAKRDIMDWYIAKYKTMKVELEAVRVCLTDKPDVNETFGILKWHSSHLRLQKNEHDLNAYLTEKGVLQLQTNKNDHSVAPEPSHTQKHANACCSGNLCVMENRDVFFGSKKNVDPPRTKKVIISETGDCIGCWCWHLEEFLYMLSVFLGPQQEKGDLIQPNSKLNVSCSENFVLHQLPGYSETTRELIKDFLLYDVPSRVPFMKKYIK
jgi:hypothetical protein